MMEIQETRQYFQQSPQQEVVQENQLQLQHLHQDQEMVYQVVLEVVELVLIIL